MMNAVKSPKQSVKNPDVQALIRKSIKYILTGIFFGMVMTKSEAISWFRIQEMFRFQSFHMYGIIGSALAIGMTFTFLIKKHKLNDIKGNPILIPDKQKSVTRYLVGGTIFGIGWALTGACPGPIFVLIGHGFGVISVVLLSAVLGTYVYGLVRDKLPH